SREYCERRQKWSLTKVIFPWASVITTMEEVLRAYMMSVTSLLTFFSWALLWAMNQLVSPERSVKTVRRVLVERSSGAKSNLGVTRRYQVPSVFRTMAKRVGKTPETQEMMISAG